MSPSENKDGAMGEVWRHCNLRLAYMKQDHLKALGPFFDTSPFVYITERFKDGFDADLQKRLIEALDKRPKEELANDAEELIRVLAQARNPPGFLTVKIKEIHDGVWPNNNVMNSRPQSAGPSAVTQEEPRKEAQPARGPQPKAGAKRRLVLGEANAAAAPAAAEPAEKKAKVPFRSVRSAADEKEAGAGEDKAGEEIFSEDKGIGKKLKVRRVFDETSKNLVYVVFTERFMKSEDPNGSRFKSVACAVHVTGQQ